MAESEAARQERVIGALVRAGMAPADAARVVETAAAADQRLPTDQEIADDAREVGTPGDIENSRQWWWLTLARMPGWQTFTRVLDAQTKEQNNA